MGIAALSDIILRQAASIDLADVAIRAIVEPAARISAVDAFKAEYRMAQYRRFVAEFFADVDFALTPTAGNIYTVDELLQDPIQLNTTLGYYTNFMNLLDCAAVALPVGFLGNGQPWGVTALSPAGGDRALLRLAGQYLSDNALPLGATGLARTAENFAATPSPDYSRRRLRRPSQRLSPQSPAHLPQRQADAGDNLRAQLQVLCAGRRPAVPARHGAGGGLGSAGG